MSTPLEVLDQRIRELCEAIVAQEGFAELYRKTDAFLRDEGAKYQFSILNDVGGYLQQKQALGAELTEEEVGHYEGLRKAALEKAVIARLEKLKGETEKASQLVAVGASKPSEKLRAEELAAYTVTANVLLNLDETVTRP